MKKKYFLFDWDGCLAKTLDLWLEAYRRQFKAHGFPVTDEQIISQFGTLGRGPEKLGVADGDEFFAKVQADVARKVPSVLLYPEVLKTLKTLQSQRKRLAIHTSSTKASVTPALKKYRLMDIVEVFLAKEDVTKAKPDPEVILKELDILKGKPYKAVVIGDGDKDVLAGKNAGVTTVLYYPKENRKFYKEEDLRKLKPDYFITDFSELLEIN